MELGRWLAAVTGGLPGRPVRSRSGGGLGWVPDEPRLDAAEPAALRRADVTVPTGSVSTPPKVLPRRMGNPSGGSMTPGAALTSIGRLFEGDPAFGGASGPCASGELIRT
jgi:hypothetical protein